jgi:hypothetical protein
LEHADFASLLRHSNFGYEGREVARLRRLKAEIPLKVGKQALDPNFSIS